MTLVVAKQCALGTDRHLVGLAEVLDGTASVDVARRRPGTLTVAAHVGNLYSALVRNILGALPAPFVVSFPQISTECSKY